MNHIATMAFVLTLACQGPPASHDSDALVRDATAPSDSAKAAVDAVTSTPDAHVSPPDAEILPDLPDLTINVERLRAEIAIEERNFEADACELDPQESCIAAPGLRKLLRFAIETPNIGSADLRLGVPSPANDNFAYSSCHDHFHFEGYADFRLLDNDDREVAFGHKQAFCLLDSSKYVDDPNVSNMARYWCGFQGISAGWSDVYHSRLDCQFIDITDTPPGEYTLRVRINGDAALEEQRMDNNTLEYKVVIGHEDLETPTEACPTDLTSHATAGPHRECGWTFAKTLDCEPGRAVGVGCSATCGRAGSCTGDPMIRVCDSARNDGNCSYAGALAFDDDSCNQLCPHTRDIRCPESGQLDIYTAPVAIGEAYTCDAGLVYQ